MNSNSFTVAGERSSTRSPRWFGCFLAVAVAALALGADPGEVLWEVDLGGVPLRTPALVEETLYAPLADGVLHVLNARDGSTRWTASVANLSDRPVVTKQGLVLAVGWTNAYHFIVALDVRSGAERWRADLGVYHHPGPLVLTPSGTVVCAVGSPYPTAAVGALDVLTGRPRWTFTNAAPKSALWPVAAGPDGRVYVRDSWLTRFEWSPPWHQEYPTTEESTLEADGSQVVETRTHRDAWSVEVGVWGAEGRLYRVTWETETRFYEVGQRYPWQVQIPRGVLHGPWREGWIGTGGGVVVDVDGEFLTTGRNQEYFVGWRPPGMITAGGSTNCWLGRFTADVSAGRWAITHTNHHLTAPALSADGWVWYATDAGRLLARGSEAGGLQQDLELPALASTPPFILPDGRILIGCANGRLVAFRGSVGPPCVSWPQANGDGRNGQSLIWEGPPRFSGTPAVRLKALDEPWRLLPHADGARPMTWQWYRDGRPLADETNQALALPALRAGDAGMYVVHAANAFGTATGHIATIDTGYRLTAIATGQGDVVVAPPGPVFVPGTEVEVRAVARAGCRFLGWLGRDTTDEVVAVVMTNHHRVQAKFSGRAGEVRWHLDDLGEVRFAPALGAGTVYFVSDARFLVAAAMSDGAIRWKASLAGRPEAAPVLTTQGTVLVAMDDQWVAAVSAADGAMRWSAQPSRWAIERLAVDEDGTVYVAAWDGEVVCLEPASGAIRWRTAVFGGPVGAPALGSGRELFLPGPRLLKLDRRTGSPIGYGDWTDGCGSAVALGARGRLYVADAKARARCVDAATGRVLWQTALPGTLPPYLRSAPVVTESGLVVWDLLGGATVGLDAETGALRVTNQVQVLRGNSGTANVSATDDLVVRGWEDGVHGWDANTGEVRWWFSFHGSGQVAQPLVGPDGGVFFGANGPTVTSFACVESGALPAAASPWPCPAGDAHNTSALAAAFRQPELRVAVLGVEVVLGFSDLADGAWVLESTGSLEAPAWQTVGMATTGQEPLRLPPTGRAQFYRLRRW